MNILVCPKCRQTTGKVNINKNPYSKVTRYTCVCQGCGYTSKYYYSLKDLRKDWK